MTKKLTNKIQVSIVSAACLLGLAIILKNVLLVPVQVLTRDIVLYIMFYSAFCVLCPNESEENGKQGFAKPLYWNLLIILITVAIVVLYAI